MSETRDVDDGDLQRTPSDEIHKVTDSARRPARPRKLSNDDAAEIGDGTDRSD